MMKHLAGPFWWASRKWFLRPGLYWHWGRNRRILPLPRPSQPPAIIGFAEQTVVYATNQPQYRPLPAWRPRSDPQGKIVCCWKLSLRDRLKVLCTGRLWHQILTFNQPLQPQMILVDKPAMPSPDQEAAQPKRKNEHRQWRPRARRD
jgi:hypothetical protein